MAYDELELDRIGDRKTAVFFIISDTTQTYNFLVALAFSQMFNLLCERADNVHGGRLPHHVRVLWDEAANTGQVPQLEKLVAVIRSREVSLCLLYQQLAQCKAIYDKHAETILGNMDSVVFLGGREASTIKEISENWLGKATISMQTDSRSRGQSESYSQNTQRLGRELMTPAELATMPGDKCLDDGRCTMDKNQGYAILKAVMLENGRGFALGEHPTAPSRYVTWACYDDRDGQRQYEWGHYGNDRTAMEQDFTDRVQDYQRIYNVGIRQTEAPGLYKYYSTQRPVDIGTFPKPPYNKPDEIFNYDQRIPVENGSFLAWGYLTYTRPLTEKQASDYELRPAPDNPDRPRPIAEQMKNAAKLAEADRGSEAPAPQRRQPDRGDR